jgi:hypothetical protein
MASFDFECFTATVRQINDSPKNDRRTHIAALKSCTGLNRIFHNETDDCGLYSISTAFEYNHEYETALKLVAHGFDVIFMPKGYFADGGKRFDVFVCRGHLCLEYDLKSITSKNPDTIKDRIRAGSYQSNRLVIDIKSNIDRMDLIDGLRMGCERNDRIFSMLLFYKSKLYELYKPQILGKNIYNLIK